MSSRQSVRHPSHNHPLRGHKCEAKDEVICSGCDFDLIGAAFKCTKSSDCDYFLHKSCFELPREINHKSHHNHTLTLLYSPKDAATYTCKACGEYGSSFSYNCSICQYDVHVGCVSMSETVKREGHTHPLTLVYGFPYKQTGLGFKCDVCEENVPDNLWSYQCKKCDNGTHLHSCKKEEEEVKKEVGGGSKSAANSELAAMLENQREVEKMQIEMHLAMQSALYAKKANKAALNAI